MADHQRGVSTLLAAVQVQPGEGVVVRSGDVLAWWELGTIASPDLDSRLAALVHEMNEAGPDAAVTAGSRVAELMRGGGDQAISGLVLAMAAPGGLRVVVAGHAQVLAPGVDIPRGWVDTELAWPGTVALGRADGRLQPPVPGSPYDLVDGGAPGSGAAVVLAPRHDLDTAAPSDDATIVWTPAAAPAPLDQHESTVGMQLPEPPPPAPSAGWDAPAPALPGPPRFSPEPAAPVPAAPMPPAQDQSAAAIYGAIVLDDGSTWALDADYVIGTQPAASPEVAAGRLRALALADPSGQVQAIHAEVRHGQGGTLLLVARARTFLLSEGSTAWQEAPPHVGLPLQPGVRVAVGPRTFTLAAPT